ncbi:hypothetical protein BGZ63DRAFT_466108 [Mariannaea sp. PMI_226]|nr:hypothetical protein BGZ63DRAFT_466108 [Mariannaea sp. PMI_226]
MSSAPNRYRPLLPLAPSSTQSQREGELVAQQPTIRTRQVTAVACEPCRKKKAKCDGLRPACDRCVHNGIRCCYSTGIGESRTVALKKQNAELKDELSQLKELLNLLRTRPLDDAAEILNRIRIINDPIAVLQSVRQAEILLPNPLATRSQSPRVQKIDTEAMNSSSIRVPARPWTTLAGDGIISELVTNFFQNDHGYLVPFIHRGSFIRDMKNQSIGESLYCSPTLLNAMCALKCLTSQRVKTLGFLTGQNMAERFLDEAKKQLEIEGCRESIPTLNALCLMYLTSALLGRDRAGVMYRYAAYEMLKRLNLEKRFTKLDPSDPEVAEMRLILSKTLWGLFCFESRMSYFYSEPSLVRPPSVPNLFDERIELYENLGEPPTALRIFTPGVFKANCALSELFYAIMTFNTMNPVIDNKGASSAKRAELYTTLTELQNSWKPILQMGDGFTAQICYLGNHISEAAFSIMQILPPDYHFPGHTRSIKELCIDYCESDSKLIEQFMKSLTPDPLLGRALFVSLSILAPYLDEPKVKILFVRNSFMLRACLPITPMVKVLLKGVQATAWSLRKSIPVDARQYFQDLDEAGATDLPVSFSLPHSNEIRALLSGEGEDGDSGLGVHLSTLVSRWSTLSVDQS